jgi:hypothetical protein
MDLHVLEAERRLRADHQRRVLRDRLRGGVEAEAELGRDLAVGEVHRDHLLDDPDPGAADPDLVAFDQGLGVGHLGLEVVGRDEGQAVVRVVGEEDRDEDHQHGDRPDEDRVACYSLYSAAVFHGPSR